MAHPVFYHNPTSKKNFFDKLMLMLVGPTFSTPLIALVILVIIELQRILLLLNVTVSNFNDDNSFARPFLSVIHWTTNFIPFEARKDMTSIDVGIAFIFSIIGILWLVFIMVFFKASFSQRVSLELTNLLRKISFFYQGIIYALFYNILIVSIQRASEDNTDLTGSDAYKNTVIIIMILLIAMNFLMGFAIVLFSYEPLYFSHDVLARRSNSHFLLSFLEKTVIITLFTFIEDKEKKVLITSIITLILQLLDFMIFVRDLPWYNTKALKIEATFTLLPLFLSCLNIVFSFVYDDTTVGFALLAGFLLIIFAVKAAHNLIEARINRALDKHVSAYQSETEIFVYFMMLEKIIGKGRYNPQFDQKLMPHSYPFYLMGIVKKHSKRCQIARCACRFYITNTEAKAFHGTKTGEEIIDSKAFSLEDQNILHEELMYFFKKDYLQRTTVAFPQWHHLKLTLANYIIDKQYENKIKALLLVYEVEKMTDSFVLKTKISQLKSIIEKALKNDERSSKMNKRVNLDVKNFIFSHNFFEELKKGVSKQVEQHLQFWHELEASEPPMAQLLKTSIKCETQYQKLRKHWSQDSRKIDGSYLQVFLYYGIYLRVVKNAREEADNILRKATRDYRNAQNAQKTEKGIDVANLYNENNIVIRISLQSDRFGHMIAVTGNVLEHFGYDAPVLINQNVNLLMPDFIKERHNDILKTYLNTGRDSMINTNRKVFGMHRNGFLVPLTMYLTPFPYIDNDYSIMAILKRARSSEDVIMLTPDGLIQGITRNIADKLGITSDIIFEANVSNFCEKFQNINMVFNYFAYIKMKTTQLRMKVYEQTDILDRQEFAERSEALLSYGTEVFNFKSSNNHPRSIDESPLLDRERTQETLRDQKLMRSLKSSKFKRQFKGTLAKAMAPQPQKSGSKAQKTDSTSFEIKTPKNSHSEQPIKMPSSSTINKAKGPKNGVSSLNSDGGGPYMRGKVDVDLFPGNHKNSSYRSSGGGSSAKSFFTQGQKLVKEFQQVLKSEQSLKAYAPTHLPSFYARDSMLASKTMLDRGSIFNKFAPIAKDISAQARALLHEEYKNIYEQFLYQGQMVRFIKFDSQGREDTTKELFFFVKVHDEKVHHDILRIFTIANTEKRNDYDAYGSGMSSESYDIDDASIHSKVENKQEPLKKENKDLGPNTLLAPPSPVIRSHVVPTFSDVKSQRTDNKQERRRNNEGEEEGSIKQRVSRNPFMTRLYRKAYQLVTGEGEEVNDASSVQSKKVVQNTEKKVEKAVNLDTVGKELNAVSRVILVIYLVAIGCLAGIAVNATQGIDNAWNIVGMLRDTCLRAINLLEVNRKIEQFSLTEQGLFDMYSLTDIADGVDEAILESQNYNNQLRRNFDQLTEDYQESVYGLKLDVKAEPNPIESLGVSSRNTFDLIKDVLTGARRILELEENSGNQDEVGNLTSYVYQNIMGGISVYLDQIVAIEKRNNQQVTSNTRMLNQYVFFLGGGLVILVLIYMINNEKNFLSRKKNFLTIWCTVPPKDIKTYKGTLTEFNQLTNTNGPDLIVLQKNVMPSMRSLTMFKKDVKRTKEGNFHQISRRGIINILIETFVLAVLVLMIGVLYIESLKIESAFDGAVTKLQRALMDYNYIQLGLTSLYLYLGNSQDIYVNNVPLLQSLDATIENLRNVNEVFLSLKGDDEVIEGKLQLFFNGDLCAFLFKDQTDCPTIGGGVLTRGLSAVQSLLAEDIVTIQMALESADPAVNDLGTILSTEPFVSMEKIYSIYIKTTFKSLTETLENDFYNEIQDIRMNYIRLIIVFGVLVVVILIPISQIGKRAMFADRINLRRTLRMVSTNYILDQKIFRAALVRDIGTDIAFI